MEVTPEVLKAAVEPARVPLFTALETGYSHYHRYDAEVGIDDSHFRTHLIRLHTLKHLRQAWDEDQPWTLESNVANCGVHLGLPGGHRVRVLAARADGVPHPGYSRTRRQFWSGNVYSPTLFDVEDPKVVPLNLLVLWTVDADGVIHLRVAAPEGEWDYQAQPRCKAIAALDHPVHGLAFVGAPDDDEPLVSVEVDPAEIDHERGLGA